MRIHEGVNRRILGTLVCKDCRNKMFLRKVIVVTVLLGFAVAHSYAGICATCHALANLQGAAQQTSSNTRSYKGRFIIERNHVFIYRNICFYQYIFGFFTGYIFRA